MSSSVDLYTSCLGRDIRCTSTRNVVQHVRLCAHRCTGIHDLKGKLNLADCCKFSFDFEKKSSKGYVHGNALSGVELHGYGCSQSHILLSDVSEFCIRNSHV